MLVLKLELHSAITGKVTEIGRTIIANDGTGNRDVGNYICKVARKQKDGTVYDNRRIWKSPLRVGSVKNHKRNQQNVWRLVLKALASAFPEEKLNDRKS